MHHAPWAKAHQLPWPPVTPTDVVMGKATACPPVREILGSDTPDRDEKQSRIVNAPTHGHGTGPWGQ